MQESSSQCRDFYHNEQQITYFCKTILSQIFHSEISKMFKKQLNNPNLISQYFQNISANQKLYQVYKMHKSLFDFVIYNEDNSIKIQLFQKQQTLSIITLNVKDLVVLCIQFLRLISEPLCLAFKNMGIIKKGFFLTIKEQSIGNGIKKHIQNLLRQRKNQVPNIEENQKVQPSTFQIKKPGIFKNFYLLEQLQVSQDQKQDRKKGGFFAVSKRRYRLKSRESKQSSIKYVAKKKLRKGKRQHMRHGCEKKLDRERNMLKYLSGLGLAELNNFAEYYILNSDKCDRTQDQNMTKDSNSPNKSEFSMINQEKLIQNPQNAVLNSVKDTPQKALQINHQDNCSPPSNQIIEENESCTDSTIDDPMSIQPQEVMYMQYYNQTLEEYIESKEKLEFNEIISFSKQILESVSLLHKVGIVHRDLKPENFMIEKQSNNYLKTKLIDFGESVHVSYPFNQNEKLGFSPHYAPLEILLKTKQGFNSKNIDLWSIGVCIYQLTKKKMPVEYFRSLIDDIKQSWRTNLFFYMAQYSRGRWSILENMLVILSMQFLKINPKQRLSINLGLKILERIQGVYKKLIPEEIHELSS